MAFEIGYYNANYNKDDLEFVTEFPFFWDTLYNPYKLTCIRLSALHILFICTWHLDIVSLEQLDTANWFSGKIKEFNQNSVDLINLKFQKS